MHTHGHNRFDSILRIGTAALFVFALASLFGACTWKKRSGPSVLVIAVEDLGFDAATCTADARADALTGFDMLCNEAIRFTHAYTPATLSVPAVASLMTGRYPHEHGVRDNGSSFLPSKVESVAEVALRTGLRTAFFGGGAPLWRNSGLNQGFELFDDNVVPTLRSLYRPAYQSVRLFMDWRTSEASRRPFFAFLHFADLQFIDAPTANDLGEDRPRNYLSQLEEVDETLGTLFRYLKEQKVWDETTIVVAGLAGHVAQPRLGEPFATTVFSERTRVTLFVKPSRSRPQNESNWKIDSNVTLADVGATLYDLFGQKPPAIEPSVISLKSIFDNPRGDWPADRLILTESAWASWRGLGGHRYALRRGPHLFLNEGGGRVFNTLTDSLETTPLSMDDVRYEDIRAPFDDFLRGRSLTPWTKLEATVALKLELAQDLWRPSGIPAGALARLRELAKRAPEDMQLQGWRAVLALRTGDWAELKDAGTKAANPVWIFVASQNLGDKNAEKSLVAPTDHCFHLFVRMHEHKSPTLRECPNQELLELFSWLDETQKGSRRQQAMDRFVRRYAAGAIEERIGEQNQVLGLRWDAPVARPDGPRVADLVLALPEHKRFRAQLERRLSGENK